MDRTILHIDADSFFASVECAMNPDIRNKPVAVAGSEEKRHGIILTANYIAKRGYGVRTGEAVWQAKKKCPELITVAPNMKLYLHFSELIRDMLRSYSDYIEPFGCDENWIELKGFFGRAGIEAARNISERVRKELGITVSIGVSFNKVFAKLGSDMNKPNGITEITRENFREKVWGLPVESLLYVGVKTKRKLNQRAVYTIGDLAHTEEHLINSWLGKNGIMLREFANGRDSSPVKMALEERDIKSVGNSTTCPYDLTNSEEVKTVLMVLAESVAERLRDHKLKGREITVSVRDNKLRWISHGMSIDFSTNISSEIEMAAEKLFHEVYSFNAPIRGLGISVSRLCSETMPEQLDLFENAEKRMKEEAIERTADVLKRRFGRRIISRARLLRDSELSGVDPKEDHKLNPGGAMKR